METEQPMKRTTPNRNWMESVWDVYRRNRFLLMFLPALIMVLVFFFIPILSLLRISFFKYTGMGLFEPDFTLASYIKFLTDPFYLQVIGYTIKIAVSVTAICLVVGYPVAYYISCTTGKWKITLLLLLIIPLWTNLIVRIYGWFVILGKQGLLNAVLLSLNLVETPASIVFTTTSVIIGLLDNVFPWVLLIMVSVMEGIPWHLLEAARDLGASRFRTFYEITFKLSLPGVAVAGLFAFVWSVGEYAVPSLLGSSARRTISIEVADQMLTVLNWPFGASMAFVLFSISIAVLLISNQLSSRSHTGR
jgi:ABC-type spermidine/putrescine transport system permease subunit I